MTLFRRTGFAALCAMLLALVSYAPVFQSGFAVDDVLVYQVQLPKLSFWGVMRNPEGVPAWGSAYFRPVSIWTYFADDTLNNLVFGEPGGDDKTRIAPERALLPHTFSLLFHLAATGLFVFFAASVLGKKGSSEVPIGVWAAGCLFALHPVHAENVAAITGRTDTLATLFLLASLLALDKAREKRLFYWLSALLFLLALLSKEVAAAGIAWLPLLFWLRRDEGRPAEESAFARKAVLFFSGTLLLYGVLRLSGGFTAGRTDLLATASSVGMFFQAAGFYVGKILWPWPVNPLVAEMPEPLITGLWLVVGISLLIGSFAAWRQGEKIYLVCWGLFLVACLPSLFVAVHPIAAARVAERYLYLPSVAFALAAGVIFEKAARRFGQSVSLFLGGSLVVAYGVTCFAAAPIWGDNETYLTVLSRQEVSMRHPRVWFGLGRLHLLKGEFREAEADFRKGLDPYMIPHAEQQGLCHGALGDLAVLRAEKERGRKNEADAAHFYREAEAQFAGAVGLVPSYWRFHAQLAMARIRQLQLAKQQGKHFDEALQQSAEKELAEALRLAPAGETAPSALRRELQALEEALPQM